MALTVTININGSFAEYEITPKSENKYSARRLRCGILDTYTYPQNLTMIKSGGVWESDTFNKTLTATIGDAIDRQEVEINK